MIHISPLDTIWEKYIRTKTGFRHNSMWISNMQLEVLYLQIKGDIGIYWTLHPSQNFIVHETPEKCTIF
jgi:hypothetical protein